MSEKRVYAHIRLNNDSMETVCGRTYIETADLDPSDVYNCEDCEGVMDVSWEAEKLKDANS